MGRYSSEPEGSFEQAPADTHIARCVRLIDLGTQHSEYQGKAITRNQVLVTWELPNAVMKTGDAAGKPFIVSAFLTNSLSEKATMRGWLEAWRGLAFTEEELKRFDLMNILGKPCLVTVIHNDKGRAVIAGVTKLPTGFECPPQVNPSSAFWLDEFTEAKFQAIPEGLRKIIMQSDEYRAIKSGHEERAPLDGSDPPAFDPHDIPF